MNAPIEKRTLAELESVIAKGFVDAARALETIRNNKLYVDAGFENFDAYCKARWNISKARASQLKAAQEVAERVNHGKLPAVTNERVARELAKLPPEEQPAAWAEVTSTTPKPTAKDVARAVAERSKSNQNIRRGGSPKVEPPTPPDKWECLGCSTLFADHVPCCGHCNLLRGEAPKPEAETAWCPYCATEWEDREAGCPFCKRNEWSEEAATHLLRSTVNQLLERWWREGCLARMPAVLEQMTSELRASLEDEPEPLARHRNPAEEIERVAAQRHEDPDYAAWRRTHGAVAEALPTRAQTIVAFVLDGGEAAMVRLGLDWASTQGDLKDAHRRLAKRLHPDQGGTAEGFQRLTRDVELVKAVLR